MALTKVSIQEVLNDIREQGGVGAAVENGYSASAMPNPELRDLWECAEDALQAIADFLGLEGDYLG